MTGVDQGTGAQRRLRVPPEFRLGWEARRPAGPRDAERAIASLTSRQFGVISRRQLISVGLGASEVDHRVRDGRLHVLFRGAYAVGTPLVPREGRLAAALLSTWPRTALSHRTGANWFDLLPAGSELHVTAPTRGRQPGLTVHRAALTREDVTWHRGLLVTKPARVFLDLAEAEGAAVAKRAMEEAERLQVYDARDVARVLQAGAGRRGVPVLAGVVDELAAGAPAAHVVRSELEHRILELCAERGLPLPLVNERIGPFEVDLQWPHVRLAAEADSWAHHGRRSAFETDRDRDAWLGDEGWRVLRITWRAMQEDWDRWADRIAAHLGRYAVP